MYFFAVSRCLCISYYFHYLFFFTQSPYQSKQSESLWKQFYSTSSEAFLMVYKMSDLFMLIIIVTFPWWSFFLSTLSVSNCWIFASLCDSLIQFLMNLAGLSRHIHILIKEGNEQAPSVRIFFGCPAVRPLDRERMDGGTDGSILRTTLYVATFNIPFWDMAKWFDWINSETLKNGHLQSNLQILIHSLNRSQIEMEQPTHSWTLKKLLKRKWWCINC